MRIVKIANELVPVLSGRLLLSPLVLMMTLVLSMTISCGEETLAHRSSNGEVKVTRLSQRDIIEKLDGKDASVTVEEVNFDPGQKDSAHRHTGAVFGYVLEGEYEHALNDGRIETYKAGDTFYEPSGSLHRIARNPNHKTRTRLLAVFLHARDTKVTTVQVEEDHK